MIRNDTQYDILTDCFFKWNVNNWNPSDGSLIFSSHFKVGEYIW